MNEAQVNKMMMAMVEKTCADGFNRMKNMPVCERFYNEMVCAGFVEQAKTFKNIVFYTTVLNPEMSDEQIFAKFIADTGITYL
ncbi:MAG: hypothetical protein PUF10_02675 [Bacteroidales bacterium]|nr:hypothetical protein [Bacteroidales bacterium]